MTGVAGAGEPGTTGAGGDGAAGAGGPGTAEAGGPGTTGGAAAASWVRKATIVGLLLVAGSVAWCAVGRATADARRIVVRHTVLADSAAQPARAGAPSDTGVAAAARGVAVPDTGHAATEMGVAVPERCPAPDSTVPIRVLVWNIAHGRGDARGMLENWRGGSAAERAVRLARMAAVLRQADADVVILNEVDFDAGWSGGVNQAEALARAAGYPTRVEQRNYDVRLPFVRYAFGNAVLTRLPVEEARWVELPAHLRLEPLILGAKATSVVRADVPGGRAVAVVPVHLEVRSEETRLEAVPVLERIRTEEAAPAILGGDFNTAPPDWPGTGARTALGELLQQGWTSLRARAEPDPDELTFPTHDPVRAIDWILVEPPLRVVRARVLSGARELSDHMPVVGCVVVPAPRM